MRLVPVLLVYVVACAVMQPGGDAVRDEPALLAAAERLVEHGQWAGTGTDPDQRAFLWHGPGLVALLAPFVALDVPLWLLRFLSPLLLFAAVVLFHRLLRLRLEPRPALAWTYGLALYAPFVFVLGTVQKEPLAVLLVVGAMSALARGRVVEAGLALAGLAMVRPEYGWVVLALLLVGALARHRWVLAPALAALACVPWLAFTYERTGEVAYWSSSPGLSLFWMSPTVAGENGQWHSPLRVYEEPELASLRPMFRRLDEVHPLASDLELRRRAMDNVRERPLRYARNLLANTGRLVVYAPARPARPPATLAVYAAGNGALLLLVAWAAPKLWRLRRRLAPEAGPFAAFAVLAVGVHLPPAASPRMLIPVVPVALWLGAEAARVRPWLLTNRSPA